ncbi:hypothetical protein [Hyalangium rubrum]|uniref:Lipoprotein n=1 Tax=Hyalangium rubrum TaxID=3103134 RepID=A0ABU5H509_9BACT|nr:hypothetical protein [Hyalangium sp. s54d21]MDY7228331.1 hypothetical protein [Hyalangium sp. s54d21]
MIGTVLMLVLAAGKGGSADELVKHQAKTLSLKVPAAWERSVEEGTQKFKAPSKDAFFLLDVGAVQTAGMQPDVCLQKILASVGGEGWERVSLGANPAAKKVEVDATEDGVDKVETHTFVGCNGKTTWSLVFSMNQKKKERFEPLALKIAQSVSYSKGK